MPSHKRFQKADGILSLSANKKLINLVCVMYVVLVIKDLNLVKLNQKMLLCSLQYLGARSCHDCEYYIGFQALKINVTLLQTSFGCLDKV